MQDCGGKAQQGGTKPRREAEVLTTMAWTTGKAGRERSNEPWHDQSSCIEFLLSHCTSAYSGSLTGVLSELLRYRVVVFGSAVLVKSFWLSLVSS